MDPLRFCSKFKRTLRSAKKHWILCAVAEKHADEVSSDVVVKFGFAPGELGTLAAVSHL
jgi:hypothetical protein